MGGPVGEDDAQKRGKKGPKRGGKGAGGGAPDPGVWGNETPKKAGIKVVRGPGGPWGASGPVWGRKIFQQRRKSRGKKGTPPGDKGGPGPGRGNPF